MNRLIIFSASKPECEVIQSMRIQNQVSGCSWALCLVAFCVLLVFYFILKVLSLLTGSILLALLILGLLLLVILRIAGVLALYPNSFYIIVSELEIGYSKRLAHQIQRHSQNFFSHLESCSKPSSNLMPGDPQIYAYVDSMIRLFSKFEHSLSQQKLNMLGAYRRLHTILNSQHTLSNQSKVPVRDFLSCAPKYHQMLNSQALINQLVAFVGQAAKDLMTQINASASTYFAPLDAGIFMTCYFKLNAEKLFEIRFAYAEWDTKFDYHLHHIATPSGEKLQCAVIYGMANADPASRIKKEKAVILNNPNGALLQFYALECRNVFFYLEQGFQVIMWNYRGYGASTGTPSLLNSIKDIESLYEFCSQTLELKPVIVHGFSVGGPPSIYLAQSHPQEIKLLIADRTFSHVHKIARQIAPFLSHIYRWIFYSDNKVDNPTVFLRVNKPKKFLVWDENDSVICDASSLKYEVMKKVFQEKFGSQTLHPQVSQSHSSSGLLARKNAENAMEEESLNEDVFSQSNLNKNLVKSSVEVNDSQDQIDAKSGTQFIRSLFDRLNERTVSLLSTIAFEIMKQRELHPETDSLQVEQEEVVNRYPRSQSIMQALDAMSLLDGGGIQLLNRQSIEAILQAVQQNIDLQELKMLTQKRVQSYFLGLILYGSYYQSRDSINSECSTSLLAARQHALQKIENCSRVLSSMASVPDQVVVKLAEEMFKICRKTRTIILRVLEDSESDEERIGTLMPTKVGHNGQLRYQEYQCIRMLVEKTLRTHQNTESPSQLMQESHIES